VGGAGTEKRPDCYDDSRIAEQVQRKSKKIWAVANSSATVFHEPECGGTLVAVAHQETGGLVVLSDFLEVCERAAREGGKRLLEWRGRVSPKHKGPKDLVTEADFASQNAIQEIVLGAFPDHRFLGEESPPTSRPGKPAATAAQSADGPGFRWVVDPLDGTSNYVHGIPSYAVSVALEQDGQIIVATVFDPNHGECFTASRGGGAFLNRRRIRTSACNCVGDALIAVSFSAHVPRGSIEVRQFAEIVHECHGVRRLGSAALNLCYVACGRMDGYYTAAVRPWDVAAGVLMLTEAGGIVSAMDGGPFVLDRPHLVGAATAALHGELRAILARVE
jgi:myo-inositol-1(or 4)-monophosphatase